jgi:pimeloyl-ACP methyl ester carboxylesterase
MTAAVRNFFDTTVFWTLKGRAFCAKDATLTLRHQDMTAFMAIVLMLFSSVLFARDLAVEAPAVGTDLQSVPMLTSSDGLHKQGFVRIGGIDQWIDIRGDDAANPVLLVLHGGPGSTWDPLVGIFHPWEKYFTLVQWDQRGAGRTYARNGPGSAAISLDQMVQDGIEVTEYVRRQLGKRKVILLGHSWGTLLGVQMVEAGPNLFCAFIGTGQVVNTQRAEALDFAEVLRRARLANDVNAAEELETIGAPPYDDVRKLAKERQLESKFAATSEQKFNSIDYVRSLYPPDFTDKDMADRNAGFFASNYALYGQKMDGPLLSVNLFSTAVDFRLPMFFIQGALDDVTPTSLVTEYVRSMRAPRKALKVIPNAGHLAVIAVPDVFLQELQHVLVPIEQRCN